METEKKEVVGKMTMQTGTEWDNAMIIVFRVDEEKALLAEDVRIPVAIREAVGIKMIGQILMKIAQDIYDEQVKVIEEQ